MTQKIFIKTYGCQMNEYDSSRMADVMAPHGFVRADTPEEADLVILNTCHIREKASDKVYSELGRLRSLKTARAGEGRQMIVAVAGCVAQAEGEEMLRQAPVIDIVVGPQVYHRLPEMVARARARNRIVDTEFPAVDKFDALPESRQVEGPCAFLTIQEGCDKFCTFCVVPYTRGAEYSRPVRQIEAEARNLVLRGVREITLLGQNVNAYHGDDGNGGECGLGPLVDVLSRIEGLERIRYTTSHPRDMDDALIEAHRVNDKLMPFLHLPVQSGSDRILDAMNRGHTRQMYVDLVARIRAARPDIALSSDFIVGYPGETDEDFAQTMDLIRTVGFAQSFSFKYSPRPGTPASAERKQVPEETKARRLEILQAELTAQMRRFMESCVGRRFDILLEKPGRYPGQMIGRSPYLQSVNVVAPHARIGDFVTVDIVAALPNSLKGELAGRSGSRQVGRN
ncbi:MAG: tRNA (N6-isopentenyl adenosine(37)-C2)-methylthiotransferase MiaB [Alphaproteobacteria bacterium]|nr:tRNA (N6-isopentenyl adenosine(37)-C2)-methylthiotransferase MiaB [Alphaproteobacteria bacterium]